MGEFKQSDLKGSNVYRHVAEYTHSEVTKPKLKFRNYKAHDKVFRQVLSAPEKPIKIDTQIKDQLVETQGEDEIGLETLQPRKPDWDLKRDLALKLANLNKRTSACLRDMLRKRLEENSTAKNENLDPKTDLKNNNNKK